MSKKKKRPEPVKVTPVPMAKVDHRGYTVVQSPRNHHVMIGKDGKMVSHSAYDHQLTEEEMRNLVDGYLLLVGK